MAQRRPGALDDEALRTTGFPACEIRQPGRYAIDAMYAIPPAGMIRYQRRKRKRLEAAGYYPDVGQFAPRDDQADWTSEGDRSSMTDSDQNAPRGLGMGDQRELARTNDVRRNERGEPLDEQAAGAAPISESADEVSEDFDTVDEASEESFPASDPPSWMTHRQ